MEKLLADNEALRKENETLHHENNELKNKLEGLEAVTGGMALSHINLRHSLSQEAAKVNELHELIAKDHARRLDEAQKHADEQQHEIDELKANTKALHAENNALRARNEELSVENEQLRLSVQKLKDQVHQLSEGLAQVKGELDARKKLLLDRSAVDAVSTALAQCLWPEGRRRPYRLNTVRQMLRFIEDVRASKTPTGYCGDNAYSTFCALTDEKKEDVFARYDAFLAAAERHGIPNLSEATQSLNSIKELATPVAHPLRGKFAKIAEDVEAALVGALKMAREDPDIDNESVLDLEDAVKLAAFATFKTTEAEPSSDTL